MRRAAALAIVPLLLATTALAAPVPKPAIHGNVLMQADEVDYDVDAQIVTARGHVEMDTDGRILLADAVSYDQKKDVMTADGHVSVTDEKGNTAFASHVVLTDKMRDGALKNFAALIGKNGRMVAANATRTQGRFTEAFDASYTPCKICNQPGQRTPVWKVQAEHVIYDQLKHKIIFRDAALEFFDVPLFFTPYLTEPDPTVRYATGILTPDLGTSTNIGYFIKVPIYIAINPSQDATITPLISTHGGEVVAGEYRQRLQDGGLWLQGSVANNPNGGLTQNKDEFYASLFGSGRIPFAANWRTGFDLQLTSNDTYLKRYDFSQLDRLVNDLFVEGSGGRTRFAITGYFFQGLRSDDDSSKIPFALPLVEFSYSPLEKWLGGQFRFDVNSVALTRNVGEDDQRFSSEVRMRWPTVLPGGQLLSLELDARGDLYHVNDVLTPSGGDKVITRGVPYAALDWRWPFISSSGAGHAFILEPIAQFILQPYGGNPAGIPNEDSAAFDLDDNNVLSFDQMPGFDLVESGPRANVGFHARAQFPSGSVDAVFGQTYRFKPDPIFVNSAPQDGTSSDLVGRVSVKFLPYIDLTDRIDIDRDNGTVRRQEVYLTGTWNRSSLQISYVQVPQTVVNITQATPDSACVSPLSTLLFCIPQRQEITAQADVNFYKDWQAFGAIRRDLLAGQMLDTELGLGYEDDCLGISIAYRRKFTTDRDLPPSTSIILRFNLKTGDQAIAPFDLFPQDVFSRP